MAETITVIGFIASIAQLIDYGQKVVSRMDEIQGKLGETPQYLKDTTTTVPLLLTTLQRTKLHAEAGFYDTETQDAIVRVVQGCQAQLRDLNDCAASVIAHDTDSTWKKGKKALHSLTLDKTLNKIQLRLNNYIQALIYHEAAGPSVDLRTPSQGRLVFNLPLPRDPLFVPRNSVFDELGSVLTLNQRAAICGIGGIGKSHTLLEYCYRFHEIHPNHHIIWLYASSMAHYTASCKDIIAQLKLPGWDKEESDMVSVLNRWLGNQDSADWLLVIDNLDDLDSYIQSKIHDDQNYIHAVKYHVIPKTGRGTIIITTRDHRIGEQLFGWHGCVRVPFMNAEEGIKLLQSRISNGESLNPDHMNKFLESMDFLPLAIAQAAAFISQNSISFVEYTQMMENQEIELEEVLNEGVTSASSGQGRESSVMKTWRLSFEQIKRNQPRAADLLCTMAMFDRQGIPAEILSNGKERKIEFVKAVGTLKAFTFISSSACDSCYDMHRLVQLSTRLWLKEQNQLPAWELRALESLLHILPPEDLEDLSTYRPLLPHIQAVLQYQFDERDAKLDHAALLHWKGLHSMETGNYSQSEEELNKAVQIRVGVLGDNHPRIMTAQLNLASVYWALGKVTDAEALHRQVIESQTLFLGREHSDTVYSICRLAIELSTIKRWEEAEILAKQILEVSEQECGADSEATLKCMETLSLIYQCHDRLDDTEIILLKLIDRTRKAHFESELYLERISSLASLYTTQCRWEEAESLAKDALEGRRQLLGARHPQTLMSVTHLALVYASMSRFQESEMLLLETISLEKKVLGRFHPAVVDALDWLAIVYTRQGHEVEAKRHLAEVVEICETIYGHDHPETKEYKAKLGKLRICS